VEIDCLGDFSIFLEYVKRPIERQRILGNDVGQNSALGIESDVVHVFKEVSYVSSDVTVIFPFL
jgi:hypothetical protein